MVKLGHLGLEMSQLVQHAISRSNGLEMSQLLQININSIKLLKIVTNHNKSSKIMKNPCESIQMETKYCESLNTKQVKIASNLIAAKPIMFEVNVNQSNNDANIK